jgi:hypothetical protein
MTGRNKTRLVGWHPSDPALVDWLDAEIGRRGGGRGAQSAILDEVLEKAMNDIETARITDADRRLVTRSRELADAHDMDALRVIAGSRPGVDGNMVRAEVLGVAQYLLGELASLIERLEAP